MNRYHVIQAKIDFNQNPSPTTATLFFREETASARLCQDCTINQLLISAMTLVFPLLNKHN